MAQQQPMRSEGELCPTNKRFIPNKSNVRIDLDEIQDKPLFEINSTPHNISEEARLEKLKKGLGKGYMRKGDMEVNSLTPKKEKDVVSRRSRTITFADNLLEDPNQAFD
ncbi:hypothetical protein Tco_0746420 [Tanacetum coccineum]